MKRKGVCKLLFFVIALTLTFCMVGCNENKEKDELIFDVLKETTVEFGQEYTIQEVFATKGTSQYKSTFEVTENGVKVEVKNGKFLIAKLTDYKIEYTADCDGEKVSKSSIIKAVDTTAPEISIFEMGRQNIDEKVSPEIIVTDFSNDVKTTIEVTYAGSVIDIEADGSFVPANKGEYTLKVTATDSSKNSNEESMPIIVGKDFVNSLSFENENDEKLIRFEGGGHFEIMENELGATDGNKTAVLHFNDARWPSIFFNLEFIKKIQSIYDNLTFDLYNGGEKMHAIAKNDNSVGYDFIDLEPKTMTTINIPVTTTFLEDKLYSGMTPRLFLNEEPNYEIGLIMYLDNIRGTMNTISKTIGETLDLSTKLNAIIAKLKDARLDNFTVLDNAGAEITAGVAKDSYTFTPRNVGNYTIKVTIKGDNYFDHIISIPLTVKKDVFVETQLTDAEVSGVMGKDGNVSVTEVNSISGTSLKEGTKALKYSVATDEGYPTYTLNKTFAASVAKVYDYLLIDVYNGGTNSHKFAMGNAWTADAITINAKTWGTVKITKDTLNNYADLRWYMDNSDTLYEIPLHIYFDNMRGGMNDIRAKVNEPINLSVKINDIKNHFQNSTIADFIVENEAGEAIVDGVSKENYTFTPGVGGNYTVKVTLNKQNCFDYVISIPLNIDKEVLIATQLKDIETTVLGKASEELVDISEVSSISGTTLKEGTKALKYSVGVDVGFPSYTLDKTFAASVAKVYDYLLIDVYNSGTKSHKFAMGNAWTADAITINAKTWGTVKITKDTLNNYADLKWYMDNGDSLYENPLYLYFDNIRGGMNELTGAVNEQIDLSVKINDIKKLYQNSTIADFIIENEAGEAIVDGVSKENYTFTPGLAGKYAVKVTLHKDSFVDLVINYKINV